MIYAALTVVLVVCAIANLAPLRPNVVCTPATHRARQAYGALCGLLALIATAMFVRAVVIGGESITANIVAGRVVTVLLVAQCVVLLRRASPPPPVALALAALDLAMALAAVIHAAA